ncbi:ran-binding protein 3-like [Notechis scutatus]|uniref:Ran-binding protein 3-like n=1 Tax=Notechis scutatus TaxID=8663 RepID=A0A6J1TVL9_9SAUR|nr:ran-binding protein 3-like [Notechis scutatus]
MKDTPHFKKRRSTWTMDQTGKPRTDIYVFHSFGCNKHKDEDISVIAQPMFVFKKERPCKRPAEDPVHKTENVPSGSRKRARASYSSFQSSELESYKPTVCSKKQVRKSSFIIIPSFPPSQPVKKNNVFMTSGVSEDCIDVKATEQDLPTSNRQREVLRPARLQLPQVTKYRIEKKRTDEKFLEENHETDNQINCRLFLFNKALLCWTERGSGCLRLNDTSSNQHGMLQSRLVMRNQGSMRLILNTKLWTQMVIERANRKSVCVTATDLEDGSVKVFLIQASTKDIESLYAAIHHRLVALKNFTKQECGINQTEYKLDVQPISCDSDDEENEKRSPGSNNGSEHSPWIRRQPVVCS